MNTSNTANVCHVSPICASEDMTDPLRVAREEKLHHEGNRFDAMRCTLHSLSSSRVKASCMLAAQSRKAWLIEARPAFQSRTSLWIFHCLRNWESSCTMGGPATAAIRTRTVGRLVHDGAKDQEEAYVAVDA
jgi:hypothetical protein